MGNVSSIPKHYDEPKIMRIYFCSFYNSTSRFDPRCLKIKKKVFSPESFKDDTAVALKPARLQAVALQTVVREDVRPAVGHDGTGD